MKIFGSKKVIISHQNMNTFIIDIETIPIYFDSLDEGSKHYLMKWSDSEEEKQTMKDQMALWAPTNIIVAIGILQVEKQRGAVYFQAPMKSVQPFEENGIKFSAGTEREILERFWKVIIHAHRFVTFNGRGFDCPVLTLRSAMLKVESTKNLMPHRYYTDQHIDLLDQLTFYGAHRKFNLHTFCKAFGIESPKDKGITGHDIKLLFEEKKYEDIARYCLGDLKATGELYLRWKDYLKK